MLSSVWPTLNGCYFLILYFFIFIYTVYIVYWDRSTLEKMLGRPTLFHLRVEEENSKGVNKGTGFQVCDHDRGLIREELSFFRNLNQASIKAVKKHKFHCQSSVGHHEGIYSIYQYFLWINFQRFLEQFHIKRNCFYIDMYLLCYS